VKKRGLENKIFLVGSRDKALEMGLEDVVPQKLKFFLYNGTHFCIKVAIGNFFLGKQIQRILFFPFFTFLLFSPLFLSFLFAFLLIYPYISLFSFPFFYSFPSFSWL